MVCVGLRGVGKKYTRNQDRSRSLTSFLWSAFSGKSRNDHWALCDIDLEIKQGERLAVLGHNGSGKTTLIRLIARTLVPTLGQVEVVGKVAPLVSFTSGFDVRLSGYDNAVLRASMFGMSRREIDSLLPEVVRFAGLEEAIDYPVETYSSGMVSRLGFSLSLHLQADIYLMDEGLSTGDSAFQAKAHQAMSERIRGHGTWVVATHDPKMAAEFCTRGIVLQHGRICAQGSMEELERAGVAF
jgi:ABC-type polysaccharide/polyol phosphate transport system ATPase subunit